jgi:hypothetical protein
LPSPRHSSQSALQSRLFLLALALFSCATLIAGPASATFHRNEITKLLVGFNGNTSIQALELKMIADGEHHLRGVRVDIYDADAVFLATLGTFNTDTIPVGLAGRNILCATSAFATTFGITPDLVITAGIPVNTAQVAFEKNPDGLTPCLVNALPYGAIIGPMGSPTWAPPLEAAGARALVRVVDLPGTPSCPLAENAGANFRETWGTSAKPIPFTNNAGVTVNVFSTITSVEADIRGALGRPRIYPNPMFSRATIEWPGVPLSYVALYNVQGKPVRVWGSPWLRTGVVVPAQIKWDGTDQAGRRLPSGVYFVRVGTTAQQFPVVLLR